MKKILLTLSIFTILSNLSYASTAEEDAEKEKKKELGIYLLATGGFIPYDSSSYNETGFTVGLTVGYNFNKFFAMELAYLHNQIDEVNSSVLGKRDVSIMHDDGKLNFIFFKDFDIFGLHLIPHAGIGLLVSGRTIGGETTPHFGAAPKIGLRLKVWKIVLGAYGEFDYRFGSTNSTVVIFEAGAAF